MTPRQVCNIFPSGTSQLLSRFANTESECVCLCVWVCVCICVSVCVGGCVGGCVCVCALRANNIWDN